MDAGDLTPASRRQALRGLGAGLWAFAGLARQAGGTPATAGSARWGWTDDELWCRSATGVLHGPWPRQHDDPTPRAVRGGLWWPGLHGLAFLAMPAAGDGPPLRSLHWVRPAGEPAQPWVWAALADGRWAAVGSGTAAAGRLHLVDRLGADSLVLEGLSLQRGALGPVRALAALDSRHSVLVDWTRGGQWWEVSLDPRAEPVYDGLVHDHRLGEALPSPGYRHPRRLSLGPSEGSPPRLRWAAADRPFALAQQGRRGLVVHLDVRQAVLAWPLDEAAEASLAWSALRVGGVAGDTAGDSLYVQAGKTWSRIDTRRWRHDAAVDAPTAGPGCSGAAGSPLAAWPARPAPWRGFADQPG